MQLPIKYSSGCSSLDKLLGGGFEAGTITQLYGEAGSGKTNISLQVAIECAKKSKKVIFIDSEGLSPERFVQIAGEDTERAAKRIVIYEPLNFEQQASAIKEMEAQIKETETNKKKKDDKIAIILLDSAILFYRLELVEERSVSLKRELANQIAHLLEIARRYNIAVIITNQVYMDVENGKLRPAGGYALEHLSKVIVQLEKIGKNKRRATIRKHRSIPEGVSCEFFITDRGIEDVIR